MFALCQNLDAKILRSKLNFECCDVFIRCSPLSHSPLSLDIHLYDNVLNIVVLNAAKIHSRWSKSTFGCCMLGRTLII